MLLNVPPASQMNAALAKARAMADARNLENFDAVVETLRAENQSLPDDLFAIRGRLAVGDIGPVEAHWLLLAPEDRPSLEEFQNMVDAAWLAHRNKQEQQVKRR